MENTNRLGSWCGEEHTKEVINSISSVALQQSFINIACAGCGLFKSSSLVPGKLGWSPSATHLQPPSASPIAEGSHCSKQAAVYQSSFQSTDGLVPAEITTDTAAAKINSVSLCSLVSVIVPFMSSCNFRSSLFAQGLQLFLVQRMSYVLPWMFLTGAFSWNNSVFLQITLAELLWFPFFHAEFARCTCLCNGKVRVKINQRKMMEFSLLVC